MKRFLIVTVALVFGFSCHKAEPVEVTEPLVINLTVQENNVAKIGNEFSFTFLSRVIDQFGNTQANIMLSPYSLGAALSMTANGTASATRDSILKTLGFDGIPMADVNAYFKKVTSAILATDPSTKLAIANSIWYRNTIKVKDPFIATNEQWYSAKVKALDFSSTDAVSTINNWSSDNTNGLIKQVLDKIYPSDIMFLLNAVYFKAIWAKGYEFNPLDTKSGEFFGDKSSPPYMNNSSSIFVNMMQKETGYLVYNDNNLTAVTIPYGNGAFEYIAVLPAEKLSTAEIARYLSESSYYNKVISQREKSAMILRMPRFKYRSDNKLNDVLTKMGMGIAFMSGLADFSNAFYDASNVCISFVKQYNYIELNETGTEAASVTIVGLEKSSIPTMVNFNKPFIYFIREKSTGVVLFAGRVANPQ